MSDYRVIVTDHDFADLSVERAILDDIAGVIDLTTKSKRRLKPTRDTSTTSGV